MAEIQPPENKPVELADQLINGVLQKFVSKAVVRALQVKFPFLAWPGVSQLLTYFIGKASAEICKELAEGTAFWIIDQQIQTKRQAYDEAVKELRDSVAAGGTDAIDQASENFDKRLRDLIRFGR